MKRVPWISIGAGLGALNVGLGAFAAHALRAQWDAQRLATFQTGVTYAFYHALALLIFGLQTRSDSRPLRFTGWAFVLGIVLFSGSLYALSALQIRQLGMITPFGGVAFLAGWTAWAVQTWK